MSTGWVFKEIVLGGYIGPVIKRAGPLLKFFFHHKNESMSNLIPIERKGGVTLYGRIVDGKCKLGNYQVHSDRFGLDSNTYTSVSEAQKRMKVILAWFE